MASVAFCSGKLTTSAHKFRSAIPCTRNPLISCKVSFEENGKPGVQSLTSNQEALPKLFTPYKSERYPMKKDESKLRVFSGTANPALSKEIACYMGLDLGDIKIKRFADGEIYVQLCESVRGCDVFLVQPTCPPANENLMELLVMIDACRRASAKTVTAVIPYFGYARADRKNQGRESISAKLVANLITEAGADRVLACDLHSGQSIGYFDIPVNHIHGQPVILDYLASKTICAEDLVVVSPDVGGVARARAFAKKLSDAPLVIVDKRRHGHNVAEVMNLIGDVKGKVAVMVDDMIDTAGTISKGAALLHHEGAREVYACCTHGVFSPPAIERLSSGLFQEVIITNSIPVSEQNYFPQLTILSVANLVGEAIWRVHDDYANSSDTHTYPERNLGVLLVTFFDMYGRKLNTSDVGISCNESGTFFSKKSKGFLNATRRSLISIQDPQTPENDIGKNSFNYFQIRSAFGMAYSTLTNTKLLMSLGPKSSILGTIIRPDKVLLERKGGLKGDVTFTKLLPGAGEHLQNDFSEHEGLFCNWNLDDEEPLPRGKEVGGDDNVVVTETVKKSKVKKTVKKMKKVPIKKRKRLSSEAES